MATVTIAQSDLEALLRRAECHTSDQDFLIGSDFSNDIVISKAEHDRLLQTVRQYNLLKSALFRGGLNQETLELLLQGQDNATADDPANQGRTNHCSSVDVSIPTTHEIHGSPQSSKDASHLHVPAQHPYFRSTSYGHSDVGSHRDDRDLVPVHDQRSVFITNLPEHTTHKDLVTIIRGGRLLDIYLRSDRSASVSFVEGAATFLSHARRNDLYLSTKRLEIRWADRQFHVPEHVARKISNGATRNLVVRAGAGKLSPAEIRDHLDHIHNLVVVDIFVKNNNVYISTNSIHNALFARTCMMSRSIYKGLRVEYYPDECASPLPLSKLRTPSVPVQASKKSPVTANIYALLDTESEGESDSDSDSDSYLTEGIKVDRLPWAEALA